MADRKCLSYHVSCILESQLTQLEELGFSTIDCQTALEQTTGDTDAAAVWLTENAKVIMFPVFQNLNLPS